MYSIVLDATQRQIVDEIHTDFRKIPNLEKIVEAISIHSSIDWFWSYSDDGNVLRHGEERVKKMQDRIEAIAKEINDPQISELGRMAPIPTGEKVTNFIDDCWPWYLAYKYTHHNRRSLEIELVLTDKLDKFNVGLDLLGRQVAFMVESLMTPIYDSSILNNNLIEIICRDVGVLPNRLHTHVMYKRGVSTSPALYGYSSATAEIALQLWSIIEQINYSYDVRDLLILHKAVNDQDVTLALRGEYINGNWAVLMLSVTRKGLSFYIPLRAIKEGRPVDETQLRQHVVTAKKELLEQLRRFYEHKKKRPGAQVQFYAMRQNTAEKTPHLLLTKLNAAWIDQGRMIYEWQGPDLTRVLRIVVKDNDGWVRPWLVEFRKEFNFAMVEVIIQDDADGYIVSADRFRVESVAYDTLSRSIVPHTAGSSMRVLDFTIVHSAVVDDEGYLKKVMNEHPSVYDLHELGQSTYEQVRGFYALSCGPEPFPINHYFQVVKAVNERHDVTKMLQAIIKEQRGC